MESSSENFQQGRLRFQKAGRKMIVTVKLNIIKRRGNAIPAGRRGGFRAAYVCQCGHDDISAAQWLSYQNDFQFDGSAW
jgi:hypothetical protein